MSTDARSAFIERYAAVLRDAGMPPMASYVFAHVLADGKVEYTAAELAQSTGASAAAISNALNYLVGLAMVERSRHAGDRRHFYRVPPGDPWSGMIARRLPVVVRWYEALSEAARDLHDEAQTDVLELGAMFFAFMAEEVPAMLERWETYRDARLGTPDSGPDAGAV